MTTSNITQTYLFSIDAIKPNFSKFTLQHGSSGLANQCTRIFFRQLYLIMKEKRKEKEKHSPFLLSTHENPGQKKKICIIIILN